MKTLLDLSFFSSSGSVSELSSGERLFEVVKKGENPENASFSASLGFDLEEEVVFTYSLVGFFRGVSYRNPVLYLTDESGAIVPLICGDDLNTVSLT